MAVSSGTRLGPYELISPLGAGGMGEVYRAKDARLGRDVAIKILPTRFSENPERLRRFEQEARSASALNHPSIITIYDIGSFESGTYIAMEYIEGKTLREILSSGTLPLRKTMDIAAKLADGLAKAHEAGIIHRDLKPENFMITKDGFAKILDFGLAKLSPMPQEEVAHLPTREQTSAGTILGTAAYMSPEQAAGQSADYRSDQFSFGTILYEMIIGKHPFRGKTVVDTLSAIVNDEPQSLGSLNPQTPAPVRWITERCMSKNPEDRYISTRDLAREIQTVRDHISGVGTSGEGTLSPQPASRIKPLWPIVSGLLLIAAVAAAFLVGKTQGFRNALTGQAQKAELKPFTLQQLTFRRGFVEEARFAPDGQNIIFDALWGGADLAEVFFTTIGSPESRPLGLKNTRLCAVSSKGEMSLLLTGNDNTPATLAQMSFAGGARREIAENISAADWSPDGKSLAVIRDDRVLEFPIGKKLYQSNDSIYAPHFSRKGDLIAFIEYHSPVRGTVCVADLDGKVRRLYEFDMQETWGTVGFTPTAAWSPSGEEIWFVAKPKTGSGWSIDAVNLSGKVREILNMDGDLRICDISKDGRVLLTHGTSTRGMVYFSQKENKERDISWFDGSQILDISDDGNTILFTENGEGGGHERSVYLRRVDEPEAVRLGDGYAIRLSPDGKWALSVLNDSLIMLPTGPGQPKTVTSLKDSVGFWFPDGKRILVYPSFPEKGHFHLYVQSVDGGAAKLVAEGLHTIGQNPISPDGKWIFAYPDTGGPFLYSIENGEKKTIPSLEPDDFPMIRWSKDGGSIFVDDGTPTIPTRVYRIDLASGRRELSKEIIPADPAGIVQIWVVMTPDAKTYAYSYTRILTDLYLIDGLK